MLPDLPVSGSDLGIRDSFGFRISDFGFVVMLLARVEGNVVSVRKHPSFAGWRLVICQPINGAGAPEGVPQVALDPHGAGMHQRVIISSDGAAARMAVRDEHSPARWMIVGIVDEPEPEATG
jgi:microcompartment protein CcmK/EutM